MAVGRDPRRRPAGTPEGAPYESIGAADAIPSLQKLMMAPRGRSPLHQTLMARVERQPLAIARVLARRYPETPAISYIPALAWAQTLRLAAITNDESLREKVWRADQTVDRGREAIVRRSRAVDRRRRHAHLRGARGRDAQSACRDPLRTS